MLLSSQIFKNDLRGMVKAYRQNLHIWPISITRSMVSESSVFCLSCKAPVYVSIEICCSPNIVSWDSWDGIVTRLRVGRTSVWILAGREFWFSVPRPTNHLFIGYWGFFPWRKWLGGHGVDYWHLSSDVGSCTSTLRCMPSWFLHGHLYLYLVPLFVICWRSGSELCYCALVM